jgi:hypothetical protein
MKKLFLAILFIAITTSTVVAETPTTKPAPAAPTADTYQHLGLMLANIQLKNSMKQAEKEYQAKVLQAKKDYVKQLHGELKKSVDKGDATLSKILVLRMAEVNKEIEAATPAATPKIKPVPVLPPTSVAHKWEGVYKFTYGTIEIQPDGKSILNGIHKGTGVSVKLDRALLITWNAGNKRASNEIFILKDGVYRSFHSHKVVSATKTK